MAARKGEPRGKPNRNAAATARIAAQDEEEEIEEHESGEPQVARLPGTEDLDEKTLPQKLERWFARNWRRSRGIRQKDEQRRRRYFRQRVPTHVGMQGEGADLQSKAVWAGTMKTYAREYSGIISGEDPRFDAVAKGPGRVHQNRASDTETWVKGWWNAVGGRHTQTLVDLDAIVYARGVSVVLWATSLWFDLPGKTKNDDGDDDEDDGSYMKRVGEYKREAPVPIALEHRPAAQCMWEDDEFTRRGLGPVRACSWEVCDWSELADKYPKSKLAKEWKKRQLQDRNTEDVRKLYVVYADRRHLVYACADAVFPNEDQGQTTAPVQIISDAMNNWQILDTFEHRLGENPFVTQLCEVTSDPAPENKLEGVFDNVLGLIDREDDALTSFATLIDRYARARAFVKMSLVNGQLPPGVNPATLTAQTIDLTITDTAQVLLPGQEVDYLTPDIASMDKALQYASLISSRIDRDVAPPSSIGQGGSDPSGFSLVMKAQLSERRLRTILARKKESIERQVRLAQLWIERIGHEDGIPVPLAVTESGSGGYAMTESDDDYDGFISLTPQRARSTRVTVTCRARLQAVDAARIQLYLQIMQGVREGWADISPAWASDQFLDLDNPERHADEANLWRLLHSEPLAQFEQRRVLEETKILEQDDLTDLVEQLKLMPPEQLAKVPIAVQQVLIEKGIVPPEAFQQAPMTPGMAATMGAGGPPGMPAPNAANTAGGAIRLPGLGMPLNQAPSAAAGSAANGGDVRGLGLGGPDAAIAAARAGQPAGATRAGI